MATFEKFVTPRLDGHYNHWSMLMENFLRSKEMWNLVDEGITSPAIGTSSASEAQRKSVEETKLKDLKKYQGSTSTKVKRAQLQALKKEFEMLVMKEGEEINSFISRTLVLESNDINIMPVDEFHGSLLVQEQRMQGNQEEEQALRFIPLKNLSTSV
ncbi:hypothetical protein KIW84_040718 [Lathyrus oleraceus]|uniref:Retrovirus-related Pol polyprotein from transposon TNT 1-94 n=1 Tax=Pisum sativum TaxID=3888 RepID=A0A9D4X6R5_PEA|nr:hypothetical protein KIW84_040718 [Pisum sativum]